jgi:DNA repair exonuclease SbcCD nuclease subunit
MVSYRVLFASDLHINSFQSHAHLLEDGTNSRLQNGVNIVREIEDYCVQYHVNAVIIGGDIFHTHGRMDVEVFNKGREAIKRLGSVVERMWCVVGNHDMSPQREDIHSLETFKDFADVIDSPREYNIGGYTIAGFPFSRDAGKQRKLFKEYDRSTIALVTTHIGIAEVPGRTFYIAEPIQQSDLPPKAGVVMLGHYHDMAQVNENTHYSGSAQSLDWGDRNRQKYCLLIDLASPRQVKALPLHGLRFLEMDLDTFLKSDQDVLAGHIVRVQALPAEESIVRRHAEVCFVADVRLVSPPAEPVAYTEVRASDRPTLHASVEGYSVLLPDGLSKEKAIRIGKELMSDALSSSE